MSTQRVRMGLVCAALAASFGCGGNKEVVETPPDADEPRQCNPFVQTGCDDGEKCANLNVSDEIVVTSCVPDGDQALGESCNPGFSTPGPDTGFDNCAAGGECIFGICRQVCTEGGAGVQPEQGSCEDDQGNGLAGVCSGFADFLPEFEDAGICTERCTLPTGDECSEDGFVCASGFNRSPEGALLSFYASCIQPLDEEATQDQPCGVTDPGTGQVSGCFRNFCAGGHGPWGFDGALADYQMPRGGSEDPDLASLYTEMAPTCVQYCKTDIGYLSDGNGNAQGDDSTGAPTCGAGFECRYLSGYSSLFDSNAPGTKISDDLGVCINVTRWGSCQGGDSYRATAFWETLIDFDGDGQIPDTGPVDYTQSIAEYNPGCFSGAQLSTAFDEVVANLPAARGDGSGKAPSMLEVLEAARPRVEQLAHGR